MTDMIDLSTVRILNSPDVHAWPATTAIRRLELRPSGVHVEFTKQTGDDRWPDFPFGEPSEHGTLQYTLWIVLKIGFQFYAAGCIEFWFGLDENGGPVDEYAKNWYYDANRWAPMTGHQPSPGELVGFFVTSGDARHGDDGVGLHERSNIVAIGFPHAAGAVYTFDAEESPAPPLPVPAPPAPPAPSPTPAPTPAPIPPLAHDETVIRLVDMLERLVMEVEELARAAIAIESQIESIARDGVRVRL